MILIRGISIKGMTQASSSGVSFDVALRCARDGSQDEWSQFLGAYRNYLRFLGRDGIGDQLQGKVGASDLAQDVLIAAQTEFQGFRGGTERELLAWLRRMLANRIVDYARKFGGARRAVKEEAIEDILYESSMAFEHVLGASGVTASQQAQTRETAAVMADALDQLPADYQTVILLRNKEGRSWQDVAARMGRSSGAARMLWIRALAELRPLLEGKL
jgi:RNA polymerase sigma-70 factor (ECF subfamily)